jgi:hypothetical protein
MAGLSFADVQDADQFYTKITTREAHSSHKKNKGNKERSMMITKFSYGSRALIYYIRNKW